MKVGIISIASDIHDPNVINRASESILAQLMDYFVLREIGIDEINEVDLPIVLIKTGGTEHIFKQLAPRLVETGKPITILATESNNSLPATLEIISWLNRNGYKNVMILHGPIDILKQKIEKRAEDIKVVEGLKNTLIGVIGKPSDWLIGSLTNYKSVSDHWGVSFLEIPLDVVFENMAKISNADVEHALGFFPRPKFKVKISGKDMVEAAKIYLAVKKTVADYRLTCLTLRCFDLLKGLDSTGCLALSRLNDEGITSGCEGDVPSLFTMLINRFISDSSSFMGNPSRIHDNKLTIAHCTVPMRMVDSFGFMSHFESGKGVGIAGKFLEGPVTITKMGGDNLNRYFCVEGRIISHVESADLCRTQLTIEIPGGVDYFFTNPLGNHHVISLGRHAKRFEEILRLYDGVNVGKLLASSVML